MSSRMKDCTLALLSAVPEPDPDHRLDLSALMEGKASNPAAWPAPFTDYGEDRLGWLEIADGHFVRAHPDQAKSLDARPASVEA